jgi:hypothetical protein
VRPDVRPPLRDLDEQERRALETWLARRGSAAA